MSWDSILASIFIYALANMVFFGEISLNWRHGSPA